MSSDIRVESFNKCQTPCITHDRGAIRSRASSGYQTVARSLIELVRDEMCHLSIFRGGVCRTNILRMLECRRLRACFLNFLFNSYISSKSSRVTHFIPRFALKDAKVIHWQKKSKINRLSFKADGTNKGKFDLWLTRKDMWVAHTYKMHTNIYLKKLEPIQFIFSNFFFFFPFLKNPCFEKNNFLQ